MIIPVVMSSSWAQALNSISSRTWLNIIVVLIVVTWCVKTIIKSKNNDYGINDNDDVDFDDDYEINNRIRLMKAQRETKQLELEILREKNKQAELKKQDLEQPDKDKEQ